MRRYLSAALAVLCLSLAIPAQSQELGKFLSAHGVTRTVWVDFDNVALRRSGTFNASVTWTGAPDCWTTACIALYEGRFGVGSWRKKGNVVGERYSYDALLDFFQAHGIRGLPTRLDREDAVLASFDGRLAVWDSLIDLAAVPVPQLPPPPAPAPPAPVDPGITPGPPCSALRPEDGYFYRPGLESTSRLKLEVVRCSPSPGGGR